MSDCQRSKCHVSNSHGTGFERIQRTSGAFALLLCPWYAAAAWELRTDASQVCSGGIGDRSLPASRW